MRQPTSLLLDTAVVFLDKHGERVGGARGGRVGCVRGVPAALREKLEAPAAVPADFLLCVQGLGVSANSVKGSTK